MLQIELDHQSAVGQTGWAAFDWNFNANGPQLAFVGGCCDAARVQLDRYRRVLQAIGTRTHWVVFGWSTRWFSINGIEAEQRPQSTEPIDTVINNVRELRDDGPGGVSPGQFLNNFTNAAIAYQSANVFAITTPIRGDVVTAAGRSIVNVLQTDPLGNGSGYATVRLLLLGFHNSDWQMGSGYPTT